MLRGPREKGRGVSASRGGVNESRPRDEREGEGERERQRERAPNLFELLLCIRGGVLVRVILQYPPHPEVRREGGKEARRRYDAEGRDELIRQREGREVADIP